MSVFIALLLTLRDCVRSRARLQLEILALRHQLNVLERSQARRLRLTRGDRLVRIWLSRVWCLANGARHRHTRHGHRLASARVPSLLDVEERPSDGAADRASRDTHPDSHDVGRESPLGCAADSRCAPEIGIHRVSDDRRHIHGPPPATALADLAYVLDQPCATADRRPTSSWCRRPRADSSTSWCCSRMIAGASFVSPSRNIPRPLGPRNSFATPSPGLRRLAVSSAIVIMRSSM